LKKPCPIYKEHDVIPSTLATLTNKLMIDKQVYQYELAAYYETNELLFPLFNVQRTLEIIPSISLPTGYRLVNELEQAAATKLWRHGKRYIPIIEEYIPLEEKDIHDFHFAELEDKTLSFKGVFLERMLLYFHFSLDHVPVVAFARSKGKHYPLYALPLPYSECSVLFFNEDKFYSNRPKFAFTPEEISYYNLSPIQNKELPITIHVSVPSPQSGLFKPSIHYYYNRIDDPRIRIKRALDPQFDLRE